MKKNFVVADIPALVTNELLPRLSRYKIITFTGPLGAGKTTLIKELLKQCGITDVVTSPTFTFLKTYQNAQNKHLFAHFDLYRLNSLESFIDAGFDEYLCKENTWVLIEWPEIIQPLLTQSKKASQLCQITLRYNLKNLSSRKIEIIP